MWISLLEDAKEDIHENSESSILHLPGRAMQNPFSNQSKLGYLRSTDTPNAWSFKTQHLEKYLFQVSQDINVSVNQNVRNPLVFTFCRILSA
jgi:hypothetical protein